jgi:hypothetical protein
MNLSKLTTGELLNYSTILENIISSNLEIQREMQEAVAAEYVTKEEIESIYNKSVSAMNEADLAYTELQKELDLRTKKDLGLKFGIRRTQSIIKELDAFVRNKNLDKQQEEAQKTLQIAKDDSTE